MLSGPLDFSPFFGYIEVMTCGKTADDMREKAWKECSLLCGFLSENCASLSADTELAIAHRALKLMEYAMGAGAIPDPF